MRTVFEYTYTLGPEISLYMPEKAEILGCYERNGQVCIIALVGNNDISTVTRNFIIVANGEYVPDCDIKYVGTFDMHNGDYKFYIFEIL